MKRHIQNEIEKLARSQQDKPENTVWQEGNWRIRNGTEYKYNVQKRISNTEKWKTRGHAQTLEEAISQTKNKQK